MACGSHPVEVVGRIRGHPEGRDGQAALSVLHDGKSVRLKHDQGYRDFVLDGVSLAEAENLRAFYNKYVEARIDDVRSGGRCTVIMYGPTGAGKSHTMFGSNKEPGVAYLALHHIMMNRLPLAVSDFNSPKIGVNVTAHVLEIYNEEVFDLLASNCVSSPGPKSLKLLPGRAKLEVRGRKVKNATCISDGDPTKLAQEIAKVEKRRVVKTTASNNRSSRSHCVVVLEVGNVGGKLILVDMAGSENSDQAGCGSEAKLQTGKINQGNGALKRVVECIANGDPYIPYRDSKLTMLLQDSFEEDGAKILMVLCANPDIRDAYKTICTFEYGAKAKCIVRLPSSPPKDTATFADGMEAVLLARLRYKDECIERLRQEYEQKERERLANSQELAQSEKEIKILQVRVQRVEQDTMERMTELKRQMEEMIQEKSKELRNEHELEMQLRAQKLGPENGHYRVSELEKLIEEQKQEIAVLRLRAEKAESELKELTKCTDDERVCSWTESSEVVDMDISNSICVSTDFTNGSRSFSRDNEEPEKQQENPEPDLTTGDLVSRNLFPANNVTSEVEVSWGDIGLFKTGWLPIIPEEADEAAEAPKYVKNDWEKNILCPSNLEKKFERHSQARGFPGVLEQAGPSECEHDSQKFDESQKSGIKKEILQQAGLSEYEHNSQAGESRDELARVDGSRSCHEAVLSDLKQCSWGGELPGGDHSYSQPAEPADIKSGSHEAEVGPKKHEQDSPEEQNAETAQRDGGLEQLEKDNGSSNSYHEDDSSGSNEGPVHKFEKDSQTGRISTKSEPAGEGFKNSGHHSDGNSAPSSFQEALLSPARSDAHCVSPEKTATRRARIENIFLLCGNHREVASKNSPRKASGDNHCFEDPRSPLGHGLHDDGEKPSPGVHLEQFTMSSEVHENEEPLKLSPGVYHLENKQLSPGIKQLFSSPSGVLHQELFKSSPGEKKHGIHHIENKQRITASPRVDPLDHKQLPSPSPGVDNVENKELLKTSPGLKYQLFKSSPGEDKQVLSPYRSKSSTEVYVKWESTKRSLGNLICVLTVSSSSTLADLRKEISLHAPTDFLFLILGDAGGAPLDKAAEGALFVSSLPASNENTNSRLACLRCTTAIRPYGSPSMTCSPLKPLENQLMMGSPVTTSNGKSRTTSSVVYGEENAEP